MGMDIPVELNGRGYCDAIFGHPFGQFRIKGEGAVRAFETGVFDLIHTGIYGIDDTRYAAAVDRYGHLYPVCGGHCR